MDDNEILEMWANRAGFPSPLRPGDATRGWWNAETALAVRRSADTTWHVDIENRGARTTEAFFETEQDANRFLLLWFGVLWRLERGLEECFSGRADPVVVISEEGSGYSVRWNGRSAAIAAKRQAIRYSHVVDEPLSRISARLMT
ncbi:MAG: hypothetical protein BGO45_16555 [Microbacterium sp. 71-36]|uniref:hypothetical protein n=1 Tax=unclassified Microbacterium TaxID=2609290 RepID=UPI000869F93E|nr:MULTISPECIES: hypothetical protein [unclassified Microbacterium]MBN9212882.1 hypothetical protein [Microbacterium sp.]ODT40257.1 MAG: hypothetical protein ABS60_04585 [Microbacterium sp. SCN 71-17]OJV78266.1 MAG: hypothetical protein BGO45_16555 [Microbacterium sp. 71-36]